MTGCGSQGPGRSSANPSQRNTALGRYLARRDGPGCYRTVPVVADRTDRTDPAVEDLRGQSAP
ncbi:hypothetical protein [Kitasatospora sp. HPMI-4]|uniref:hypothetical protein n=1 Tax=Kitasatospora sp. HPMI-4 TaxID=3448443 RepID=UPI003F1A4D2B